jgi:putative addiction module antidote
MAKKLKVRRIGNSLGIILPKEILEQMRVEEGDALDFTASKDGVKIMAADPMFAQELAVFKSLSRRYRNALGELAK